MAVIRRLTYIEPPQPDEALISWLDRTAAALEINRKGILEAVGLIGASSEHPVALGVDLTDLEYSSVTRATGVEREQLATMLLRRYEHTALDFTAFNPAVPSSVAPWAAAQWAQITRSHCCPGCVAESPGWQVRWRTSLQFCCPRHHTYIVHHCPRCGTPLYSSTKQSAQFELCCGPPDVQQPFRHDGRHRVRRGGDDICGQEITGIDAPVCSDDMLLDTQEQILRLLDAEPDEQPSARSTIAALRSCIQLALQLGTPGLLDGRDPLLQERFVEHCTERDDPAPRRGQKQLSDRSYRRSFTDPVLTAAATAIAADLVLEDEPDEAFARFVAPTYQTPLLKIRWTQLDKFWAPPPTLQRHLADARARHAYSVSAHLDGRARHRTQSSGHATLSWRNVPQLMWDEWMPQVEHVFARGWREHQRRFLAVSLARRLSPTLTTWRQAAEQLGLDGEMEANCQRLSSMLRQTHQGPIIDQHLDALIEALERLDEPIDYHDRRDRLAHLLDLDADEWERIVLTTGRKTVNRYWEQRRQAAAAWVWVTATGGDFHFAPALNLDQFTGKALNQAENRYRQYFVRAALPEIHEPLKDLAVIVLRRHGVTGPLRQVPHAPA
jgi:hypothetical protein